MNTRRSIFEWCRISLHERTKKLEAQKYTCKDCNSLEMDRKHLKILRKASAMVQSDPEFEKPMKTCQLSADEIRGWKLKDMLSFRREAGAALPIELPSEFSLYGNLDRYALCAASAIAPGAFLCLNSNFAPTEAASLGVWDGIRPIMETEESIARKIVSGKAKFVFLSPDVITHACRHSSLLNALRQSTDVDISTAGKKDKCLPCSDGITLQTDLPDKTLMKAIATPRYSSLAILFRVAYELGFLIKWQNEDKDIYFIITGHLKWFDFYAFRDVLLYPLRIIGSIGHNPGIAGVVNWLDTFIHKHFKMDKANYIIIDKNEALYFRHRFPEYYTETDYEACGTCQAIPLYLVGEKGLCLDELGNVKEHLAHCHFPTSRINIKSSLIRSDFLRDDKQKNSFWIETGYKFNFFLNDRSEEFRTLCRAKRASQVLNLSLASKNV
ncbi:transcriptional regulator [Perkinsela sp. CCAP 1560/4]|nr:transcriptional regulator [Perkinsela sp. CCAP 1560/4]|eukprot:KNH09669.1 transcriptional regulator [Perkinsela sp. CCAP 1560/4]